MGLLIYAVVVDQPTKHWQVQYSSSTSVGLVLLPFCSSPPFLFATLILFSFYSSTTFPFGFSCGDLLLEVGEMTGDKAGEEEELVTIDLLRQKMDDFARERNWERFHSPRNLLLALVIAPCFVVL